MKRKHMMVLITVMLLMVVSIWGFAEVNPTDVSPYDLTVAQIAEDELHPYGSARLMFKVNNLPTETSDVTLTWYVSIEKKIGSGIWFEAELVPATQMASSHLVAPNTYSYEQLWTEGYNWDGMSTIQYRVQVVLDDLVANRGGKSNYSNSASLGLQSSPWAVPELNKANGIGLIPDLLKSADLTKPITREEFCEIAVLLYEKSTGKAAVAVSPNPFTDTTNPQILKAFSLGVTNGISATTFEPKTLINREQCAAMLFRAIKAIAPTADFGTQGVAVFPDQKYISGWAVEATKYMFKHKIITGDAQGNFMPKATTDQQVASGYGMATREQAIVLAMRAYTSVTK